MIVDASPANVTADAVEPGSGWPLSTTNNLYFRNDTDCQQLRSLLKFFYWALTAPIATQEVEVLGYAPLSAEMKKQSLDTLLQTTCKNQIVLAIQEQPMHTSRAFQAFLSFAIILLGIVFSLLKH